MSKITDAFSGLWASLVRTYSPWIVGTVVGWLSTFGVPLDDELKPAMLTLVMLLTGAIYYLIIRVLERLKPKFGWLLGSTQQPTYARPDAE